MKFTASIRLVAFGTLVLIALNACGGSGGGSASSAASTVPRFAYVANGGDDTVSIYTVSAGSGALRHHGYVDTSGDFPISVALDPRGRFVYVANADSDDLAAGEDARSVATTGAVQ